MNQRAHWVTSSLNPLKIAVLAVLVAASGCATAPADEAQGGAETTVTSTKVVGFLTDNITHETTADTRTIAVATDVVWGVLGGVYEQLGIPVTTTDPMTMTVGNLGYEARRIDGVRMNAYVDCGNSPAGPVANQYAVTLSVMTKLAKVGESRTEVSTVVDASAKSRAMAGYPVQCTTREKLEELIIKKVGEALGTES